VIETIEDFYTDIEPKACYYMMKNLAVNKIETGNDELKDSNLESV